MGTDEDGKAFESQYLPAATHAMELLRQLGEALSGTGVGLAQMAADYTGAEDAIAGGLDSVRSDLPGSG